MSGGGHGAWDGVRGRGSQVASQVSRDSEREGVSGVNKEGKAHRVRNLSAEALKGGLMDV